MELFQEYLNSEIDEMQDKVQKYLNVVGWSTVTIIAAEFKTNRHNIVMVLAKMLAEQDVRIYGGEIVHV